MQANDDLTAGWGRACRELARADPVMAGLVARYPGEALVPHGDTFRTLMRAITGQQISVSAAEAIWRRLLGRLGAATPAAVLASDEATLAACGLTRRKAAALHGIASAFRDGYRIEGAPGDADAALLALPGVGRWTADMVSIFALGRPDILPAADIGLLRAVSRHYAVARDDLDAVALAQIAEAWRPWRSVATWYLWRDLDPVPVAY